MNNKEFITALSERLEMSPKELQRMIASFSDTLADTLEEGDSFTVQSFGSFDVKKKQERVVINPVTKQRQLVPPKLALSFKAANALKDKTAKS